MNNSKATIVILREEKGVYTGHIMVGGVELMAPITHSCIESVIREVAADILDGFAHFVEVTYYGMSTGTFTVLEAAEKAGLMAERLIALIAEEHRIMGG